MRHVWITLAVVVSLAAMLAIGVLVAQFAPIGTAYYTDGNAIRVPASAETPRQVMWLPPERVPSLTDDAAVAQEYEPRLSWDGNTLFFVRGKAGGSADIWQARRTPAGWTDAKPLDAINTADADELGPELSPDGGTLYFYSNRAGGLGGYDLWRSTLVGETWQPPTNLGDTVNSTFNDYGPAIAPDGATLYFSSNRPRPTDARQPNPQAWPATVREEHFHRTYDLYQATLSERGIGIAVAINALNTPASEGAPCVSIAGDFLYFASDRVGGRGAFDLYRARLLRGAPGDVENLGPTVNTPANELDPGLGPLGFAIYFSSDRSTIAASQPAGETPRYSLFYTASREVFLEREARRPFDWAALLAAILPNLLWLLLALLLLALLLLVGRDLQRRTLGLMTRCVLASVAAHLLLMILLNFWKVTAAVVDMVQRSGEPIEVALVNDTAGGELFSQINAEAVDVSPARSESVEPITAELEPLLDSQTRAATLEVPTMQPQESRETIDIAARDATPPSTSVNTPIEIAATLAAPSFETPAMPQPQRAAATEAQLTQATTPTEATPTVAVEPVTVRETTTRSEVPALARSESLDTTATVEPLSVREAHVAMRHDATMPTLDAAAGSMPDVSIKLPEAITPKADATETRPLASVATTAVPAASSTTPIATSQPTARMTPTSMPIASANRSESDDARHEPLEPRDAVVASNAGRASSPIAANNVLVDTPQVAVRLPSETRATPSAASAETEQSPRTAARTEVPQAAIQTATNSSAKPTTARTVDVARSTPRASNDIALAADLTTPRDFRTEERSVGDRSPNARSPSSGTAESARSDTAFASLLATPSLSDSGITTRMPSETTVPADTYAHRAPEKRTAQLQRGGGNPETEAAVNRALAWLAKHQSADGRWDADGYDAGCDACAGQSRFPVDHALTGLSLLCFLGAGHTHTADGPYRDNVQRGIRFLVSQQSSDGDLRRGETIYSHGIAAIALSEAYGMTADPTLADPVRRAIAFIVAAQDPRTGGWRYEPGEDGDTSVMGWQVMALKSAELAGVPIPSETYQRVGAWLKRVESPELYGAYCYRPGEPPTQAMTGEALFVREMLRIGGDPRQAAASVEFIGSFPPRWGPDASTYGWYYCTLALYHQQGEPWQRWNRVLQQTLLSRQVRDGNAAGSWPVEGLWADVGGRVYQTAICTLMLETYYRYLPLFGGGNENRAGMVGEIGAVVGRVTARDGSPIVGATVRLDMAGANEVIATTDADGTYRLAAGQVPDFFVISASAADHVPQSRNVSRRAIAGRDLPLDFTLEAAGESLLALEVEPDVHHLGNDRWEGRINSQFQKPSIGGVLTIEFEVNDEQFADAARRLELLVLARGVQCPHVVTINGRTLDTHLDRSPEDGSFGEIALPLPKRVLRRGPNTLEVRGVSCRGDLDDFELVNFRIRMAR
ncbi:MAG: hypothetical protein ACKVS9_14775 [Phycisphaerae bacterium]